MAMPGGGGQGGGPMGPMQGQLAQLTAQQQQQHSQQQQQQLIHQQMVAQQQQAAAAAAQAQAQAQQQQMAMNAAQGMMSGGGHPVGGPSPHPPPGGGGPGMMGPGHPQGGGGGAPQQPHPGQPHPGGHPMMNPGGVHPGHPPPGQGGGQGGHGPPQLAHQQEQARMDNISKAKSLVDPIKNTLSTLLRTASNAIYANNMVDSGTKPVDYDVSKLDRSLEEFFSLCDQMEIHLKTSIECINQGMSSSRYLQTPVTLNKTEGSLTYPQYINVVKGQIAYAKEVHGTLAEAAQKLNE